MKPILWAMGAALFFAPGAHAQEPVAPAAKAEVRYTVTDLGTLGGKFSIANAINSRGEIAGQAMDKLGHLRAVKWVGGKAIDCGLTNESSNALDINDSGIMVGYLGKTWSTASAALSWEADNKAKRFPSPEGWKEGGSALRAINNKGQAVGYASDTEDGEVEGDAQAFLFSMEDRTIAPLKGDEVNIIPNGINAAGEAVMTVSYEGKQRAWKFPTKLPMEIEGDLQLLDINDKGEIAACLSGGQAMLLKTQGLEIAAIQYGAGLPTRINNSGVMVGLGEGGATLFEKREAIDLNTLIPADSGWTLTSANGINDAGQIVGFGKYKDSDMRAFLLSPVKK